MWLAIVDNYSFDLPFATYSFKPIKEREAPRRGRQDTDVFNNKQKTVRRESCWASRLLSIKAATSSPFSLKPLKYFLMRFLMFGIVQLSDQVT